MGNTFIIIDDKNLQACMKNALQISKSEKCKQEEAAEEKEK